MTEDLLSYTARIALAEKDAEIARLTARLAEVTEENRRLVDAAFRSQYPNRSLSEQPVEPCPVSAKPHRLAFALFSDEERADSFLEGSRKLRCVDCGREVYEVVEVTNG